MFRSIYIKVLVAFLLLWAADGFARITVTDSGIGIPSADPSRVFERFYRVDKGRSREVGGAGLGLSIVKHAMEQMNGSATVESNLGKVSKFTISLPLDAWSPGAEPADHCHV